MFFPNRSRGNAFVGDGKVNAGGCVQFSNGGNANELWSSESVACESRVETCDTRFRNMRHRVWRINSFVFVKYQSQALCDEC